MYFGQDPNPPLFKANLALGPTEFTTPKTAAQQNGEECSIALAFQGFGSRSLPETARFLRREPVSQPDTQFLRPFDTTYARSKLRAQQPGVGRLVSEPTDCSQSHVDGPRRQLASFEMNSVARDDRLVEGQAGLGTIPGDEFIDGMSIAALRLG